MDKMVSFNLHSALQASRIAALKLSPGGLLVLTGAAAALEPTKGMIAYGVTKGKLSKSISSQFARHLSFNRLLSCDPSFDQIHGPGAASPVFCSRHFARHN